MVFSAISASPLGGDLFGKFEVGAFPATLATAQVNWLLALSGRRYSTKHGASCTMRAWRRLVDLGRAVAVHDPLPCYVSVDLSGRGSWLSK
jgi:hypothetical protein